MDMRTTNNARDAASKIVRRAWNLPPGMRPGDESPPEPDWHDSSVIEVYESTDAEELDKAMREAIHESAYMELTDDQVEELATGDHYSPVSVDLDWDSARLGFRLTKATAIRDAPKTFSVTVQNPFVG